MSFNDEVYWRDDAACAGMPLGLFYPEGDSSFVKASMARAKAVCATCTVIDKCRSDMIGQEDPKNRHGVWGNTTPDERREKARGRPPVLCVHGLRASGREGYCGECYLEKVADFYGRGECPKGHELTLEDIVPSAQGYPQCRQCRMDSSREWRERQKAS